MLLRRKFPTSVIYAGAVLDQASILDRHSVVFRDVTLVTSTLGAYSYVQSATAIFNAEIGPFCSIAGDVTIGLAMHPTHMVSTSPVFYDNEQPLPSFFTKSKQFTNNLPRTTIGADVWIGQGAMIKAGVLIGVGAVIGAGAVVTKDIPPYAVAIGCPGRVIRQRFPQDISERLLASCWWDLDDIVLERLAPFFADPAQFLDRLDAVK